MRVMITGSNRGIGAALAARYQAAGDRVFAASRHGTPPLDVTDPAAQSDYANHVGDALDLLICNAGVFLDKTAEPMGTSATEWQATFAANVTGVYLTIQAQLPAVRAASGKIAIMSSQMGSNERARGRSYVYRASKAAVLNLGRNLAVDLADDGIAVGIYHPGWVITDMGGQDAAVTVDQSADGLVARFAALSPATTGVFEDYAGTPMPF